MPTASWEAAGVLIDVIDVLGVPVHTIGLGLIGEGAVGVLAAGTTGPSPLTPGSISVIPTRAPRAVPERWPAPSRPTRHSRPSSSGSWPSGRDDRSSRSKRSGGRGGYLDAPSAIALGYADCLSV